MYMRTLALRFLRIYGYESILPSWDKLVTDDNIVDIDENGYITDTPQIIPKTFYYYR